MPAVGPAMPPPAMRAVRIVLDMVAIGSSSLLVLLLTLVTIELDLKELVKKMLKCDPWPMSLGGLRWR